MKSSDEDFPNTIYTISNNREKILSSSKRKFFFNYIADYRGEPSVSVSVDYGNFIHDTLEEVLEKPEHLRKTILNNKLKKLKSSVEDKYESEIYKRLNDALPPLLDIMTRYEIIALEFKIKTVYKYLDPRSRLARLLYQMTPIEYRQPEGITGIGFNGILDAYVKEDGDYVIIDWKTGNYSLDKLIKYERQVQVYAKAMRKLGYKVDRGMIVWVDTGREDEVKVSKMTATAKFDEMFNNFITEINKGVSFDLFNEGCCNKWYCENQVECAIVDGDLDILDEKYIEIWKKSLRNFKL